MRKSMGTPNFRKEHDTILYGDWLIDTICIITGLTGGILIGIDMKRSP